MHLGRCQRPCHRLGAKVVPGFGRDRRRGLGGVSGTVEAAGSVRGGAVGGSLAVSVRGLRKAYGPVEAVRGVDLEIPVGQIFALLGPNGAGKTTTVEILEGYRSRDAGDVEVLGCDPASERSRLGRGSGSSSSRLASSRT